jgi:hypothetical protein
MDREKAQAGVQLDIIQGPNVASALVQAPSAMLAIVQVSAKITGLAQLKQADQFSVKN